MYFEIYLLRYETRESFKYEAKHNCLNISIISEVVINAFRTIFQKSAEIKLYTYCLKKFRKRTFIKNRESCIDFKVTIKESKVI